MLYEKKQMGKKKKLQGRNKSSHDTAFGLANTLRMMWETPAGAGSGFAGCCKVLCAVAVSSFSLLLPELLSPVTC